REGRLPEGIEYSVRLDAHDRAGVAFVFEWQQRQFNDFICVWIEPCRFGVDEHAAPSFAARSFERPVARRRNTLQQAEVRAGLNEALGGGKVHSPITTHATG